MCHGWRVRQQQQTHTRVAALGHASTKVPPKSLHSLAYPEAMDSLHPQVVFIGTAQHSTAQHSTAQRMTPALRTTGFVCRQEKELLKAAAEPGVT